MKESLMWQHRREVYQRTEYRILQMFVFDCLDIMKYDRISFTLFYNLLIISNDFFNFSLTLKTGGVEQIFHITIFCLYTQLQDINMTT